MAEQRPLTRIDVVELSAALTALAHEPLLAAYRYQRRAAEAVTLAFDVTRFPDAAVLAAAADRATATTLVTPEGRSLTEVSLTVRNQAQPFLRVGLPAGATLLSAEVAGAAVKPAQGADGLRIPLLRPGFRPQGPYAVSFVYLHAGPAFAAKGDASLTLARVDLPVAWLEWEMLLPDRMEASRFDGTAFPRELMPVASPMAAVDGLAESVTVVAGDKSRRDQRADEQRAVAERAEPAEARRRRAAGAPRRPPRRPVPHLRASAGDGRGDARVVPLQVEEIATSEAPSVEDTVSRSVLPELLPMLVRETPRDVAGTTLRGVQRILAAGLIAIFVALSALHVFWAAGGRAGGAVAIPRQGGEALFTPSPLATLAVAVALAAAAATVAAAAGWFGARGPTRAGRVLTAVLAVIFLARAVGDFRYVGFFKSLGDDPFRSWDTWLFSPLCLAIALAALTVARSREP